MKENEITIISTAKEIDELFHDKQIKLSNALVQAREKTSLLESKIELLGHYKLVDGQAEKINKIDTDGNSYLVRRVEINASEIRSLTGRSGGSLYDQMYAVASFLKSKSYIYRDKGAGNFRIENLYTAVEYSNGVLGIEFNPSTENLLLDLQKDYVQLKLDVAFKFTTNGGLQLYKKHSALMYKLPPIDMSLDQKDFPTEAVQYPSLAEFRLLMGYVDLDQPNIRAESLKRNPDNDKITEMEKKPKFKRWSDFFTKVVEPGRMEVNKISDIYIPEIKPIKGAHGKVVGIIVYLQRNKAFYEKDKKTKLPDKNIATISESEKDDIIDMIMDLIPEVQKIKEARSIAEAAGYNSDKIKKAIAVLKGQKGAVNITPFMIKAIKEEWEPSSIYEGQKKGSFFDYEQSDSIDLETLGKNIYAN